MNDETVLRVPNPCSDNQKSAIQSPKWWGIFVIAVAFAICGAVVEAQQPKKTHRIGYLSLGLGIQPNEEAFLQRLRELGYIDGQNIVIEWRFAKGKADLLPELAAELVRLKVDVIIASATVAIQAANG